MTNLLRFHQFVRTTNLIKPKRLFLCLISILLVIIGIIIIKPPLPTATQELVLNLPKSHYQARESILFHVASISTSGQTLCNSKLELKIMERKWQFFKRVTTTLKPIPLTTCGAADTAEPDYIARWTPEKPGQYFLTLTNLDTKKRISQNLNVSKNLRGETADPQTEPISISRWAPTRISSSVARNPMTIKITAHQDFSGEVTETVPSSFKFIWYGNGKVSQNLISWSINLKKGESITLPYEFSYSGNTPVLAKTLNLKTGTNEIVSSSWNFIFTK